MPNKLEYSFILEQINKYGYHLESEEYLNANEKLGVICPKNHSYNVTWREFNRGTRCPICYGRRKNNIENIKRYAKNFGYIILSNEYFRSVKHITIKCPNGHVYKSAWGSFQSGSRCPTCWNIKNRGENHSNWKGGVSFEPYCEIFNNDDFKEYIFSRDDYKCLNPLCNKKSEVLCRHHIDYNKQNCIPKNIITLCLSCNSVANYNRKWYKAWYQAIMFRRYRYNHRSK